jgi:uncharacterized protein (DUF2249 family)
MKEITLETKIHDLLNDYEGMKEILIGINPKFKKLNNPVLRRTIGRVAGVRQAAIVGGMDPMELLNQLRIAVGQEPTCEDCPIKSDACLMPAPEPKPLWLQGDPVMHLDANEILDADKNPLAIARKALRSLKAEEYILLTADFRPEPLIEEFIKDGYRVYVEETDAGLFHTYIQKEK